MTKSLREIYNRPLFAGLWTLDVWTFGRWDVGTLGRSNVLTLDVGSWTLNAGWSLSCWTLLDAVGRCWTLLDVVGRCWTLLDVVGRCWPLLDVRTFRRWTFGGWTSDVGCLRLHVGRRDIGR